MPDVPLYDVDKEALIAATDELAFEELLKAYKPFILSCTKKTSGLPFVDEHDDIASIGILAFYDAVHTFESGKAGFLQYAGTVIRNRVIDHLRQSSKLQTVSYEAEDDNEYGGNVFIISESVKRHHELSEAEMRRLEIESLIAELREWNISLEHVYADAPKHESMRVLVWEIVRFILGDKDLCRTVMQKRLVPVAEIEKSLKIPRKKIEKSRRFIIACILIAIGDYPMLSDYLRLVVMR